VAHGINMSDEDESDAADENGGGDGDGAGDDGFVQTTAGALRRRVPGELSVKKKKKKKGAAGLAVSQSLGRTSVATPATAAAPLTASSSLRASTLRSSGHWIPPSGHIFAGLTPTTTLNASGQRRSGW